MTPGQRSRLVRLRYLHSSLRKVSQSPGRTGEEGQGEAYAPAKGLREHVAGRRGVARRCWCLLIRQERICKRIYYVVACDSGQAINTERLWKEFISDPSQWWDNRLAKVHAGARSEDWRYYFVDDDLWI